VSTDLRVVAIGGGHGTAVTLRALRLYASTITAIVTTADDGGSSGRLRDVLGLPALGDARKCLIALAAESSTLGATLGVRYEEGPLSGHAVGNFVLAGLLLEGMDLVTALARAGELLGAVGTVLPATTTPTELHAELRKGSLSGQAQIGRAGEIRSLQILPSGVRSPRAALEAIEQADQVVVGPGSLYTSVLAAAAVPDIATALRETSAQRVFVCNLRPEIPETLGYTVADHLNALISHGVEVDFVLWDPDGTMELGRPEMAVRAADLKGSNGLVHEPGKLARALQALLY